MTSTDGVQIENDFSALVEMKNLFDQERKARRLEEK